MDILEKAYKNQKACWVSLDTWCAHNKVLFSGCGRGSYTEKTGRDTVAHYSIISKSGKPYYIYFNASYIPYKRGKKSAFSSITLYDFVTDTVVHKTHIDKPTDIKDFYAHIESVILDK